MSRPVADYLALPELVYEGWVTPSATQTHPLFTNFRERTLSMGWVWKEFSTCCKYPLSQVNPELPS